VFILRTQIVNVFAHYLFFFDKKKYININIIKRKIGANRHLTKGYKSYTKGYIHPMYKLSSKINSSKAEEHNFPLFQK